MPIIKIPNAAQAADKVYLATRLTPFPPDDVAAEMVVIHAERGAGAHCGCAACVEQFGDDLQTEDFPMQLKFDLSLDMTNAIIGALGETPYKVAAPIIAELQRQAQPQMQPQLVPEQKAADDGAA